MSTKPSSENEKTIKELTEVRDILALKREILILENEIQYFQGLSDGSISRENEETE